MINEGELQVLAMRHGWKIRPLTPADVSSMSSAELEWHEKYNSAELEKAIAEPARQWEAARKHETDKGVAIWSLKKSGEDYYSEQVEWTDRHPQFIQTYRPNIEAIAKALMPKNLVPNYANIDSAFCGLTMKGELLLDASACGAGPEIEVGGFALKSHRNLWKILEPVIKKNAEQERIDKMSAEEFQASRPEFHDTRTSPIARESVERALNSFTKSHPEYVTSHRNYVALEQWLRELDLPISFSNLEAAYQGCRNAGLLEINDSVSQYGSTRVVDYGDTGQHGVPPQPQKDSFRQKLKSMSADELRERCNEDKSFRHAVDALEK